MAIRFNPLTGNFDFTGSGGGGGGSAFFSGEVATYADLPLDGTAALNSRWLVRSNSGTWPFSSYKQAGIYIRIGTVGSDRDDDYQLTDTSFHDVMSDDAFLIFDNTDPTKAAKFDVGTNVPTTSTVTLTVPAANGTIARTETFAAPPAIGNTTPAAISGTTGTFTTLTATPTSGSALTLTGGTVTASAPLISATQTWNDNAVTFTGLAATITNTASATGSLVARFTVGSTNVFEVDARGFTKVRKVSTSTEFVPVFEVLRGTTSVVRLRDDGDVNANSFGITGAGNVIINTSGVGVLSTGRFGFSDSAFGGGTDTDLRRDAADTLAQRRGTNAQTFRIYNTFTSTTNFERLNIIAQSAGSVIIGTEKGSAGGTARALEFQTDGSTRLTISTGGSIVHGILDGVFGWTSSTIVRPISGNGTLRLSNNAQNDFNRLQFGGTTSSFPALKRSSTELQVRLADDSAFAPLACGALTLNGNLDASTRDLVTDTTTGTKIGTATTQKIGFWNATPAVQPAAVADATDAASTQARLNDLLARLRTIGIIAT